MIKFFRKIRQKLLSESQFSKYLIYAIGEIVLVVIGILIALGINSWNESRIAIRNEYKVLSNLIVDLEEQSDQLDKYIAGEKEYYDAGLYLSEHYAMNKGFYLDDTLLTKLNLLGARITFKPVNATFQELISTGNIGLIRNEENRKRLIRVYDEAERISEISANNNTNIVDGLYNPLLFRLTLFVHKMEYASEYTKWVFGGISEDHKRIFDSHSLENLYDAARDLIGTPENTLHLFNLIQIRTQMASVQLVKYNQLKEEIQRVIQEIESDL